MGNETPNTPNFSETNLRGMQVDELRERARREGVGNADELRAEELVGAISDKHRRPGAGGAGGGEATGGGATAGGDGGARGGGGNDSPNTPDLSETRLRAMQMDELRDRARREGVGGAEDLRRDELISAISAKHRGG